MRTLMQIIDAAKRGQGDKPTYEELFYGMISLEMLASQNDRGMHKLLFGRNPATLDSLKVEAETGFQRTKQVLNSDPKMWLGAAYDYANPDVQSRARMSSKILEAIEKREENPS